MRRNVVLRPNIVAWFLAASHIRSACSVGLHGLYVEHTGELHVQQRLNRSLSHLGADSCESKEPCIRWESRPTRKGAAAMSNKTAMRPFDKLLWTLV